MDINRRLGKGRLSEYFGEVSLHTDRIMRTMGFNRKGEQDLQNISPNVHKLLQSYAGDYGKT